MPKPSSSLKSTEPDADESALRTVAKGLAGHKALLYGFGVILVISATCQILRTEFALYIWIVFAVYLVGSVIWLVTRDHADLRSPNRLGESSTVVRIKGSKRVRGVANRAGHGSTKVAIINAEDVEDVANDTGRTGQQAHGSEPV
jgi:hypothetical protein